MASGQKTAEVEVSELRARLDANEIRVKDVSKAAEIWERIAVARDNETKSLRLELKKLRSQLAELSSNAIRKALTPINTTNCSQQVLYFAFSNSEVFIFQELDERFTKLENLKLQLDSSLQRMKSEMVEEASIQERVHVGCQIEIEFIPRKQQWTQTDPVFLQYPVLKQEATCQTSDVEVEDQEPSLRPSSKEGQDLDQGILIEPTTFQDFSDGYLEDRDDSDCSPSFSRTDIDAFFRSRHHPDLGPWKRLSSSFGSSRGNSSRRRRSRTRSKFKKSSSRSTSKATTEAPVVKASVQSDAFTLHEMDDLLDSALKSAFSHKDRALEQVRTRCFLFEFVKFAF